MSQAEPSIAELLDQQAARRERWIPASGGTEQPFTLNGHRLQYMWNSLTGSYCKHAYLDLDSDIFLSEDDERRLRLR